MFKVVYVLLMLCQNGQVLLNQRGGSVGFGGNQYALVGGRVEKNETAKEALQREAQEELGVDIDSDDMDLVHTVNRQGTENELYLLLFKADKWRGHVENKEPEKYAQVVWRDLRELPENMIPDHKQALELIQKGVTYSEHGWSHR